MTGLSSSPERIDTGDSTVPEGHIRSGQAADSQALKGADPSLIDAGQVAQALAVDPEQGLSEQEAARRLERFGPNELAGEPPTPGWRKFLEQFKDPLVYLLLAATLISLLAWVVERTHPSAGSSSSPLPFDAIVIVIILLANAALGYAQEAKAERAVEALADMTAARANVLRAGRVRSLNTSEIVPGDVVVLAEGDTICADGRLFAAAGLHVSEASLTGESVPVSKRVGKLSQPAPLADRSNMVFNGTAVTQGTGRMVVTATGMETQVGKIAQLLAHTPEEPTPLQKEMAKVSKVLGVAVCAIAVVVLAALALMEGFRSAQDVIDSLLMAVSLAVAAVPEGLTAIMTVVLALGVQRMAKHHAIVKKLSSVETLGSASVICSDKTGTLTRNEMTVERVLVPAGQVRLSGTGYEPVGEMLPVGGVEAQEESEEHGSGRAAHDGNGGRSLAPQASASEVKVSPLLAGDVVWALAVGALANDGELVELPEQTPQEAQEGTTSELKAETGIGASVGANVPHTGQDGPVQSRWEAVGDPTEVCVVVAARKVRADDIVADFHRLAEIPFTSERKMMSVVASRAAAQVEADWERPSRGQEEQALDGREFTGRELVGQEPTSQVGLFTKGAPDVLLSRCDYIREAGQVRPLTGQDRASIMGQIEELSSEAYRTLGQAYRWLSGAELQDFAVPCGNAVGSGSGSEAEISAEIETRAETKCETEAGPDSDFQAPSPALKLSTERVVEGSDRLENGLIWTGMVGIIDPPRTEVRAAVSQAHRAGIRTVMITGDHPLTAGKIASDLGIIRAGEPTCTGTQLDQMNQPELDRTTAQVSVYARVAPEHKLQIVESLKRQGQIVAMTGDGVNDAPAVKAADIGVAMGITGTEVTKESAKMILADDNFATIVQAVREGRGIFDNIRKFLRYLLSSNMGEVFTVFGGVVFAGILGIAQPGSVGVTVPILATQLLWINLLTDAAPALAMGVDPQTEDTMGRPPRKMSDRVIDRDMWIDIVYIGLVMALVTLIGMDMHLSGGLFTDRSVSALGHEAQLREARTVGFTILVFAQLFNALASRSSRQSALVGLWSNAWLWGAIALSVALQLLVIYVPFLSAAFGTTPLTPTTWLECLGLAFTVLLASELRKLGKRAWRKVRG
ncbi:haloacid dehalogenase [Bombiscardovia nodaiensis]|uniref:Haloacid dehalogenase n=1 Tax=Bombiscardovia nodaiensis TaxID=2932181 RepID=A0ABM8BB79_9BIFI|nr:haloacid dehalogenase [Bombiscardovia nodaiensis]